MRVDSDVDIFDAVVHVERDAFRYGVESARASPSVGSEQFEEGMQTGFFRGYEIALEAAFMRTCAEEFAHRAAPSTQTTSAVSDDSRPAAVMPRSTAQTGLRQGRHTAALLKHIDRLPRKNIADFDFQHAMEMIRAEYIAAGGSIAMPLMRNTSGGAETGRPNRTTKPPRVSLDW